MIPVIIVACEVGFWIFLLSGLTTRYLFRRRRLGLILLATAPLVDVVLLIVTVLDLRGGGTATVAHSLAAFYIGASVAFGHAMVKWADRRFARRFGTDEEARLATPTRPTYGWAHTRDMWRGTFHVWAAALVAGGLLAAMIWMVGDPSRTEALARGFHTLAVIVSIDLIITVSYTIWPRKDPAGHGRGAREGDELVDGQSPSPSRENSAAPVNSTAERMR